MNPLNESEMLEIIGDSLVITVDNHNVMGGIGSRMAEFVENDSPRRSSSIGC